MEMMGFDASPPDPVVVTSDRGEEPKMKRNILKEFIIIVATLAAIALFFGALHLFGNEPNLLHDSLDLHKYDEAIELIRLGGDMNAMNADGELPLVLAADDSSDNAYDVVRELILAGARVNETDGEGFTALHRAAYRGNLAVADLLLRHGADVNAVRAYKNFYGKYTETPLEVAYKRGMFRVAEFLTSMGADTPDNLKSLKQMGEMERLRDYYDKYPKPPNYTDAEWDKEVHRRIMRQVNPEMARLTEEFMRMNPEAMKTLDRIMNEPAPEGVGWREWENQQAQKAYMLLQSGQFKIPEPKK